jgi:hypothetical protein
MIGVLHLLVRWTPHVSIINFCPSLAFLSPEQNNIWNGWNGPASPDAGVELLRQLFLQCWFLDTGCRLMGVGSWLSVFIVSHFSRFQCPALMKMLSENCVRFLLKLKIFPLHYPHFTFDISKVISTKGSYGTHRPKDLSPKGSWLRFEPVTYFATGRCAVSELSHTQKPNWKKSSCIYIYIYIYISYVYEYISVKQRGCFV